MNTEAHGTTHIGLIKTTNEDSILIDRELGLYIVCDGVSEGGRGAQASKMAPQTIQRILKESPKALERYRSSPSVTTRLKLEELLKHAVQTANLQIFTQSRNGESAGMGTTAEVLWNVGDYALIAHIGDSRTYLLRQKRIHPLTEDHTIAREMIQAGSWSSKDAAQNPLGKHLARVLGTQEFAQIDTLQVELMAGDQFLLCSDGVHKYSAALDPFRIPREGSTPEATSQAIIDSALKMGGHDNATALVFRVHTITNSSSAVAALQKTDIIRQLPLFRYFNYQEINKLLSISHVIRVGANTTLIQEGAAGSEMFILLDGKAEVKKGDVFITGREKGHSFGEMAMLDNSPRSASVKTTTPCDLMKIERDNLFGLLKKDPPLAVKFFWALSQDLNQRLRIATQQFADSRATTMILPPTLPSNALNAGEHSDIPPIETEELQFENLAPPSSG